MDQHSEEKYDAIVLGGGPAGIIAAGRIAQLGGKVIILEKMKRPGRKLLITGKGRCNISNDAPQSTHFKNIFPRGRFLKHAYKAFFVKDIVEILNHNGVATTTERGNRIFPNSNQAKDVLQALLRWMNKNPVSIYTHTRALELCIEQGKVTGVLAEHEGRTVRYTTKNVILCTGGKSYPATGSTGDGYALAKKAGHTLSAVRPALVPLNTAGTLARDLQGLALKNVQASLWINGKKQYEEFGEMLFAHFGLTGPIILSLSRFAVDEIRKGHKTNIHIDLKPALDEQKLDARLLRDLDAHGKKQIDNLAREWLPAKLIPVLLSLAKINPMKVGHQVTAKERRKLMHLMKNMPFELTGYRGYEEAIITAGGIPTEEINDKTMQSKVVQNLYFAGEVIDLDAKTGGYNLQIAWSTAWLAANSCMAGAQSE